MPFRPSYTIISSARGLGKSYALLTARNNKTGQEFGFLIRRLHCKPKSRYFKTAFHFREWFNSGYPLILRGAKLKPWTSL